MFTTEFWIMLVIHGTIFVWSYRRISKRKKELSKENAHLTVENDKMSRKVEYFKELLTKNDSGK